MSDCSERELRAGMTEDEFWDHVFPQLAREYDGPNLLDEEDMQALSYIVQPCPECGALGACAYDDEGRALIHATGDTDDDAQ